MKTQFGVIPFLLDEKPSATMQALRTITASCDRAIARSVPPKQSVELQKAILADLQAAGLVDSISWKDFEVIYQRDHDEFGPFCFAILALETEDGHQHFPPFNELTGAIIPSASDITDDLRAARGEGFDR